MPQSLTRRRFLKQSAWLSSALTLGAHVNPAVRAADSNSALERLNIASVGTANQAGRNLHQVTGENIVALADVDAQFLDRASIQYSHARKYRDWRVMLEKEEKRIDAVLVGTPDHVHAPAAAMALRMGKHVFCEKPLTHTIYEA